MKNVVIDSTCPRCKSSNDDHAAVVQKDDGKLDVNVEELTPDLGDISICFKCAAISIFHAEEETPNNIFLKEMTKDIWELYDEEERELIQAISSSILIKNISENDDI